MLNTRFKKWAVVFVFFISMSNAYSNNLQISNITINNKNIIDHTVFVQFDISWENSWRLSTGPSNWDAAWVFIKYRVNGGVWKHATLSATDLDHISTVGSTVDASADGKGAFIFRSAVGSGNNAWTAQLKWLYGADGMADDAINLEVKVFGIEMVYVNQGDFYVGDGVSVGRLWNASDVNTNPALISTSPVFLKCESTSYDDAQLKGSGILVDGDNGIDTNGIAAINNTGFPTGYRAFYCMKQEISNDQFAQFLNTLSRTQQNARTYRDISGIAVSSPFPINRNGTIDHRNCVRYTNPTGTTTEPLHFFCDLNNNGIENDIDDGQNVAICNIGWPDGTAYADWAGLRPMTELEYEKACRGPEVPVANEYAWHTANIYGNSTTQYDFNNLGQPNEYPQIVGTGIYANASYEYTTGHVDATHPTRFDSPIRCGIFATATSNRINAGASYYGILDLAGGMAERCVTLGEIEGRIFHGTNGDGTLTVAPNNQGNATNDDWPGISSSQPGDGVIIQAGSGFKGGDWNDGLENLKVSNRVFAAQDIYVPANVGPGTAHVSSGSGNIGSGFRCVRTAD